MFEVYLIHDHITLGVICHFFLQPSSIVKMIAKTNVEATHYMVLGLPGPSRSLNKSVLKSAYHKALLQHHPDKSRKFETAIPSPEEVNRHSEYSVDQITTAYRILSDPVTRAEYDREIRLAAANTKEPGKGAGTGDDSIFRIGLELYDLDDLEMEEGGGLNGSDIWYHACRCGDKKGFLVSESDLEREAEWGEIIVGCRGCSIWAKITFAVGDD